jgi:hypothetical protein
MCRKSGTWKHESNEIFKGQTSLQEVGEENPESDNEARGKGETMKLIMGCDFVRDANWQPKEFRSDASIIRYAKRTMPKDLKRLGFGVGLRHGPEYVRASYGRKC